MSNLRQRLLDQSAKSIRRKVVSILGVDETEPLKVEVRSPTLAQSSLFAKGAEGDGLAQARVMTQIVIQCSFDPDSGAAIFNASDEALLMDLPAQGSFIEPIVTALTELMGEAKAAAKN